MIYEEAYPPLPRLMELGILAENAEAVTVCLERLEKEMPDHRLFFAYHYSRYIHKLLRVLITEEKQKETTSDPVL